MDSVAVKRAFASVAASQTASSLVAAVTGKKIRVIGMIVFVAGTATVSTFNTNTTAISPAFSIGINGAMVLPVSLAGWLETVAGDPLTVTTGAGSATVYHILYIEV